MKSLRYMLALITTFAIVLVPRSVALAETVTDGGKPYAHNMGFSWWVILVITLACVGVVSLTTYLIINHIKGKKNKDKDTNK